MTTRTFSILVLVLVTLCPTAGKVLASETTILEPPNHRSALSAPTLTVTTSATTVTASWTTVTGATGYTLSYAPYPYTGPDSVVSVDMGTRTSISVNLWEGAAFYVTVQAYNGTGNSGYSNIESFIIGSSSPIIEGCSIFPSNNIWNTRIDNLPVDPNSSTYINTIGADTGLHPDFGSGEWDGGPIGIPYITVPGTQAKVAITFYYAEESDPGPYPIPPDAPIEGGSDSTGDRHVLVLDKDSCMLYELFDAYPQADNSWYAGSGAVFDLRSHKLRPDTWTSADAAGLPILPGLVRYDEVISGEINHAIRFTAPQTRKAHIWPARHNASHLTDDIYPPMGQRFRLKADYDISGFSLIIQTILKAFKRYGIILADNGSAWFISGVPDSRWDNDILRELRDVKGSDFEAVDESSLMIDKDSGEAKQNSGSNDVYVNKNN